MPNSKEQCQKCKSFIKDGAGNDWDCSKMSQDYMFGIVLLRKTCKLFKPKSKK